MSIELFAIGSSGLSLVALIVMVATRTTEVPAERHRDRRPPR
jgi:hypothetical protein